MEFTLRPARMADAPALLGIYAPYVTDTAVTYEYDVPSEAEFARRMEAVMAKYPYLVAERNGEILGYAYASPFHPRAAYRCSAELSVYLRMDVRGCGMGRRLYEALEAALRPQGFTNLYACIAWTEAEDEYLTHDSVRFHEKMGFHLAGTFRGCAVKFGRRYDMVYMEKHII